MELGAGSDDGLELGAGSDGALEVGAGSDGALELGAGRWPEDSVELDRWAAGGPLGARPSTSDSSRRAAGVATGVLPVAPPATVWRPAARPAA
jgi:hypothetical protein